MNKIIVGSNDAGKRLDSFLLSCFCYVPKVLVYKLIRKRKIQVNNKRIEIDYRLAKNDVVTVHTKIEAFQSVDKNNDFLKVTPLLNIVYEDANLLVVNKPNGLLCHPDKNNKLDCLINRIKKYLYNKNEYNPSLENSFSPSLVNRIDRNTTGLVLAAKNAISLRILNKKLKNREIKKYYKCLVYGKLSKNEDIITGFLSKNQETNTVNISKIRTEQSKLIQTKYRVLNYENDISLVEIELLTGRTHQIRAHMAFMGHPIVGDKKYGISTKNNHVRYQQLVSYKIKFDFKFDAGVLEYLNHKIISIGYNF